MTETVRATLASRGLRAARMRIDQESFSLAPLRETAAQRRLVREAAAAARVMSDDRIALQDALAGVSQAVRPPVYIDTLRLARAGNGWRSLMSGAVTGPTSAFAIRSLHEVSRSIPQRLRVDSLRLDSLSYDESDDARRATHVRFQFSFGILSSVGGGRRD